MTEDEATQLVGLLVGATGGGWTDSAVDLFVAELSTWDDMEAAVASIRRLARTPKQWRPSLGEVIEDYQRERERQRQLHEPAAITGPRLDPARGREIAYQAYCDELGLPQTPETRERFSERLNNPMTWAKYVEQQAPQADIDKALKVVGNGARYAVVWRAFGKDHMRAGRALRTLEKAGWIVHDPSGWITPSAHRAVVREVGPNVDRHPGERGTTLHQEPALGADDF